MANNRTRFAKRKKSRFFKYLFFLIVLLAVAYGVYTYFEDEEKPLASSEASFFRKSSIPVVKPRPMDHYGQPFKPVNPEAPLISFVLVDFGNFPELSQQALEQLPPEVTVAISPAIDKAGEWAQKARDKQHEVLVNVPMEPDNYPANDPGPQTLLTSLSPAQNIERLASALQKVPVAVGITHTSGSYFTTYEVALEPILQELRRRGLVFLDTLMSPYSLGAKIARHEGTSYMVSYEFCGENPEIFGQELKRLELIAKQKGYSVAVAPLSPFVLKQLSAWVQTLPKDQFSLAPLTAVIKASKHDAP